MHAYAWAVPNRQYASWVKDKRTFFTFLAIVNMAIYFCSIVLGSYLYECSRKGTTDGVVGYFGVAIMFTSVTANSLMMVMLGLTLYTLVHRFDYELRPYQPPHGRGLLASRDQPSTSKI
jgi:hypothetical protein